MTPKQILLELGRLIGERACRIPARFSAVPGPSEAAVLQDLKVKASSDSRMHAIAVPL